MKYLFMLVLLIIAGAGALLGGVVVYRWINNMADTVRAVPGERIFVMPTGVVPRGGELLIPKEKRDIAARRPNPIQMSKDSVEIGRQHYATFCTPCHGPEAKGGVSGLVATKFIPTPDLTNRELQRQRTDGYWQSYIMAGGAVMPGYAEAMSAREAWHVVNYLRSLAAK